MSRKWASGGEHFQRRPIFDGAPAAAASVLQALHGGGNPAIPAGLTRPGTLNSFHMLGGSEFRLRQGFACGKTLVRRKSAAAQKGRRVVFKVAN